MRNERWVWPEVRDAGTSGAGAVPLRSAQMMGQLKKKRKKKEKEKKRITEPCFGIGHNLSLICQLTSEDIKHQFIIISLMKFIVQELCESRGGRPELSVLTILLVSVDVKVC